MQHLNDIAISLNKQAASQNASGRIKALRAAMSGSIVFTTSFGIEDQAITHLIASAGLDIHIVTLDTGRLFPETYDVWMKTERRYGISIQAHFPHSHAIETLVSAQGINGFYRSVDARKACCHVRKVEPLDRALGSAEGWITGLRAEQSEFRRGHSFVSFEEARQLVKLNPIFDWTRAETVQFTEQNEVPVNALHERGFLSIGCAPCTRPVADNEPERAGRWWWETQSKTECGLHIEADSSLLRAGNDS